MTKPKIPLLIMAELKERFGEKLPLPTGTDLRLPRAACWPGTESALQTAYFAWVAGMVATGHTMLYLAHAIPNGDAREPRVAARLKREGVKAGVPDVFIPVMQHMRTTPLGKYPKAGLYIEFKKAGGSPEPHQRALLNMLWTQNYEVAVINDLETAKELTCAHLGVMNYE